MAYGQFTLAKEPPAAEMGTMSGDVGTSVNPLASDGFIAHPAMPDFPSDREIVTENL